VKSEWKPVLYTYVIYLYTALVVRIAYCVKGKKVSFFLNHAMRTRNGEYCFFNLGARWGWVVNILILREAWGLQSPPPFCIFIMLPQVMKSNVCIYIYTNGNILHISKSGTKPLLSHDFPQRALLESITNKII